MRGARKLLLLVYTPLALVGCGGGPCGDFCDAVVQCEGYCGGDFEDDVEDVITECNEACDEAVEGLSSSEEEDFDECSACLLDDIGDVDSCDFDDLADAFEDCDNECDPEDLEDFYEEFFDEFEPDCEQTPCEQAAAICGGGGGQGGTCTGDVLCASQCIVNANSCDLTGNEPLLNCIGGCQ